MAQEFRRRRFVARLAGPRIIRAFAECFPQATFVEIGANDGDKHDHLRPMILAHDWRGVMVEPVPYLFERLRVNYRGVPGVAVENSAVAASDGWLPFYHLAPSADYAREGLPYWYDGIGSLSREAVLAHGRLIADIESRLVVTRVPCLTFESLLVKHGLQNIDLLLTDTEGYDGELIQQIDFAVHRPALVIYEHYHLARADRLACRARMEEHGYLTMAEGFDTWCLSRDVDARLLRAWQRLEPALPEQCVEDELG